jgi:AbrB family looped-hinge helix DNA binding protein
MNTVTVSSKYQVVIPKEVRERIGIKVGATLEIMTYGNRIELVPIISMKKLKCIYKGLNTEVERENDRL